MKPLKVAGAVIASVLILVGLAAAYRVFQNRGPQKPNWPADTTPAGAARQVHPSFLYGRITTVDGATFEGRIRYGGDQEAFWSNYFNGYRQQNPWASYVPPERIAKEDDSIRVLGLQVLRRERPVEFTRLFLTRFGDIARIEASGRDVNLTLKSGTVVKLDRFNASDFDDGIRVWDTKSGTVDLDSLRIQTVQFLPSPHNAPAPDRLHGTVRTLKGGTFTGFLQWDREQSLGSDELTSEGEDDEEVRLRFDTIRSMTRRTTGGGGTIVALKDGRQIILMRRGHRGVYVDDVRYGRVLVSWNQFATVEFTPPGDAPTYADFPPGEPLRGAVTNHAGQRLDGRLVFDLDESETNETLDAPAQRVDYTLPFGLIATIAVPAPEQRHAQPATVTLRSGEKLELDCRGDLGERNGGMLIFAEGREKPEFVSWADVRLIELERPRAMFPSTAAK